MPEFLTDLTYTTYTAAGGGGGVVLNISFTIPFSSVK